jgi:adenylosuccinate synthase
MARTTFPGQAAWSKINHLSEYQQVLENRGYHFDDTAAYLQGAASDERDILIEGTQGSGLSLVHGPWPYVTSCDTNVAQMLVDTGLPPGALTETILVARTYPIRVAGHSGPMFKEIDWGAIGVEPERTTVTDKIRRVGMWDEDLVKRAIAFNQPCSLAITFLDYLFPGCQGARERHELSEEETLWLMETEERLDTKIQFVGTGPSATKFEVVRL